MTEGGSLEFNRLLPSNGLSKDTDKLQQQLTYLRQGIESNPVLEALLIYYEDDQGNRCEILDDEGKLTSSLRKHLLDKCAAKATFIVGSYSDELKDDSQPWIREHRELMKHYEQILLLSTVIGNNWPMAQKNQESWYPHVPGACKHMIRKAYLVQVVKQYGCSGGLAWPALFFGPR